MDPYIFPSSPPPVGLDTGAYSFTPLFATNSTFQFRPSYLPIPKPPYTYKALAIMAILQSPEKALPTAKVLLRLCDMFPAFFSRSHTYIYTGWKSGISSCLSAYLCFVRDKETNSWSVDLNFVKQSDFHRRNTAVARQGTYAFQLHEELGVPRIEVPNPIINKPSYPSRVVPASSTTIQNVRSQEGLSTLPSSSQPSTSQSLTTTATMPRLALSSVLPITYQPPEAITPVENNSATVHNPSSDVDIQQSSTKSLTEQDNQVSSVNDSFPETAQDISHAPASCIPMLSPTLSTDASQLHDFQDLSFSVPDLSRVWEILNQTILSKHPSCAATFGDELAKCTRPSSMVTDLPALHGGKEQKNVSSIIRLPSRANRSKNCRIDDLFQLRAQNYNREDIQSTTEYSSQCEQPSKTPKRKQCMPTKISHPTNECQTISQTQRVCQDSIYRHSPSPVGHVDPLSPPSPFIQPQQPSRSSTPYNHVTSPTNRNSAVRPKQAYHPYMSPTHYLSVMQNQ